MKSLNRAAGFLLLVALLSSSASAFQSLPKGVERVTSVEGIAEYRLENGLRALLFPDQSKQTITVNITYLVGSRHENYGETGMAHLLEHLMFKGTPTHKNIPQEMTERGADSDGTTDLDRTNYYEILPATDSNLEWAIKLEADRMVNSLIDKKDLDSEMTVVRNEFEMGENNPQAILVERMLSTAYLWHNYGKSVIGARSDIENVPIERLKAFYKTYYQPDNAILIIAGKFDEAKALELIHSAFGPIPRPSRQLPRFYTAEPVQDGERAVTLRRVGDVQMVASAYHIPSGSHPDAAAMDILVEVLSDTPSGRLHKALVESKKAASIEGFDFLQRDPGVVFFGASVRQEASLEAARDALIETIEKASSVPVTKEEVERARARLLKQFELDLNSSEQVCIELSEWAAMGDWRLIFWHRDQLKKVTAADVQRVASAYLKPSNRTLGLFIPTAKPDRAEIPPAPDISAMLKDYKGEAAVAAGEAFDSSPANIEARTVRPAAAGGPEMALLPKKTRGATVVASLVLRFGDEKSLFDRSTAGNLAAEMLARGTARHTRQQLKDEFDRLKARVGVAGGANSVTVSIETLRDNLAAVIKLVAEILREPSFPAAEFEQLKQEALAAIEEERSEPVQMAANEFQRHLSPYPKGDVRYTKTVEESIAAIKAATLDEVKKFHADFYGASNATLAVVGDFDDREIARLASELFSTWKSPRPFARLASAYRDIAPINKSIEAPDKENAFFIAGMNLALSDTDEDYAALTLANYMLGGGFLNSRLATRIRQKEGLSYAVGTQLEASPLEKSGAFVAYAIYAPQNAAKLEAAFKEEMEKALKDGFTAEEVAAARNGFLQTAQLERSQDGQLAARMASNIYLKRTMMWDAEFEKKISALTPDVILAALRRHVDLSRMTIIKSGNFAKK
jgi:zinc protease